MRQGPSDGVASDYQNAKHKAGKRRLSEAVKAEVSRAKEALDMTTAFAECVCGWFVTGPMYLVENRAGTHAASHVKKHQCTSYCLTGARQ